MKGVWRRLEVAWPGCSAADLTTDEASLRAAEDVSFALCTELERDVDEVEGGMLMGEVAEVATAQFQARFQGSAGCSQDNAKLVSTSARRERVRAGLSGGAGLRRLSGLGNGERER